MPTTIKTYGMGESWQAWVRTSWTASTTTASLWSDWNNQVLWANGTTSVDGTWSTWTSSNVVTYSSSGYAGEIAREELRDARREAEWAAIREERERERELRDVLQAEARATAHALLALVLSPAQLASYAASRYFDVEGSDGGVFRIHHGTSGNIAQIVEGREVNRLCVHPQLWAPSDDASGYGYLPTEDCLAAQALAIMHDELGTVDKANVHRGVRHLRAVA